jgi:DNA-binding response OmpR family regulator
LERLCYNILEQVMKNKRILVIDDVFQIRHNYTQFLIENGYEAFSADSGISGLEACEKISPDLIILDYDLRDMYCFQFLEILRDYEKNLRDVVQINTIPAIVISGYLTEDKVKPVADELGICGFLYKPINLNDLLKEVELAFCDKITRNAKFEKKIIIADSESRTAEFLSSYLGQLEFNISICLKLTDFEKLTTEIKPDLAIFDLHIIRDQALKFNPCELVKKHNPEAKIFITTFISADTKQSPCDIVGYDKLFTKPLNLKELKSEVLKALQFQKT